MLSFLNFMIILWLCNKIHLPLGNTNLSIKGQVCLRYTFKWFWKKILYTHTYTYENTHTHIGSPDVSEGKASACQCRRPTFDPGVGRSPGKGNDNPLQYSCLGNPMDRGAWWATVHGVTESDTTEQIYAANRLKEMEEFFVLCLELFSKFEIVSR